MTKLFKERMTVEIEGEFVLYLIGMRINRFWKIHKWFPVFIAMPRMLNELASDPNSGLLGYRLLNLFSVVQYWRSLDHLIAYARQKDSAHLPAWRAFNKAFAKDSDDVGIWHETYRIQPGCYEVVYRNMPAFGLGAAFDLVPVGSHRDNAYDRIRQRQANSELNMA